MKYTKEQLEPIVKTVFSLSDVCRQLGKTPIGGNVNHVKQLIIKFGLNFSHFTGSSHNKGKTASTKKTPKDILIKSDKPQHGFRLKRALVESGHQEVCACCGIGVEWNHNKLVLEVDHINGDRTDHREDNLRFLCPNCHSQTPTYSGRNNSLRGTRTHTSCDAPF